MANRAVRLTLRLVGEGLVEDSPGRAPPLAFRQGVATPCLDWRACDEANKPEGLPYSSGRDARSTDERRYFARPSHSFSLDFWVWIA